MSLCCVVLYRPQHKQQSPGLDVRIGGAHFAIKIWHCHRPLVDLASLQCRDGTRRNEPGFRRCRVAFRKGGRKCVWMWGGGGCTHGFHVLTVAERSLTKPPSRGRSAVPTGAVDYRQTVAHFMLCRRRRRVFTVACCSCLMMDRGNTVDGPRLYDHAILFLPPKSLDTWRRDPGTQNL